VILLDLATQVYYTKFNKITLWTKLCSYPEHLHSNTLPINIIFFKSIPFFISLISFSWPTINVDGWIMRFCSRFLPRSFQVIKYNRSPIWRCIKCGEKKRFQVNTVRGPWIVICYVKRIIDLNIFFSLVCKNRKFCTEIRLRVLVIRRSQWPRGLRHELSLLARTLRCGFESHPRHKCLFAFIPYFCFVCR
jgi:hypothetical protein